MEIDIDKKENILSKNEDLQKLTMKK